MAICYKQRKVANQVASMRVIGDVEGKDVVLVDDICDTGGTLTKAADMMKDHGATVSAPCAHIRSCRALPTSGLQDERLD